MNLDQQRRYARQIMLTDVGEAGQQKLRNARVLIIGAGGLGSAIISYLAAAGVGHIGIIDDDRVELSNLARQIIHETGDIGRLKVQSARDRVAELNPEVEVRTYPFALTKENAMEIIGGMPSPVAAAPTSPGGGGNAAAPSREKLQRLNLSQPIQRGLPLPPGEVGAAATGEGKFTGYDVIADGCDNFGTRFVVNQACVRAKIPLVSAAIAGWHGQVMTIAPHLEPETGCYQCFAHPDAPETNSCRETGIIGPLAGIIGSMQALEVVNCILGKPALVSKLLRYDARTMEQRMSSVARDAGCGVCALPAHKRDAITSA